MQRLQCQAWEQVHPEQLKRAEHRRRGQEGFWGRGGCQQEGPYTIPRLPGSLLFREQVGLGRRPEKKSSW